jgi:hypothetical protein
MVGTYGKDGRLNPPPKNTVSKYNIASKKSRTTMKEMER